MDNSCFAEDLRAILLSNPVRCGVLATVEAVGLPDCWVGAGFVRDAIWDHLHGRHVSMPSGDVDIIWFDGARASAAYDRTIEGQLRAHAPFIDWSVKNQARMHRRNGDAPYDCVADAMRFWPETATAVAVRMSKGRLEINAPLGLDDLFALRLRPTGHFTSAKRAIFEQRIADKRWLTRYPKVRIVDASGC